MPKINHLPIQENAKNNSTGDILDKLVIADKGRRPSLTESRPGASIKSNPILIVTDPSLQVRNDSFIPRELDALKPDPIVRGGRAPLQQNRSTQSVISTAADRGRFLLLSRLELHCLFPTNSKFNQDRSLLLNAQPKIADKAAALAIDLKSAYDAIHEEKGKPATQRSLQTIAVAQKSITNLSMKIDPLLQRHKTLLKTPGYDAEEFAKKFGFRYRELD